MSIGGVSGASGYAASAFWPTSAFGQAPAVAAAGSSEDFLSGLAGGTGGSASAGSQSSAQSMLAAIQDPSQAVSAGYYNQMVMLNAFGSGTSGDDDSSPFDLLSQTPLTQSLQAQNVKGTYNNSLLTQYGAGASSAGLDYTV